MFDRPPTTEEVEGILFQKPEEQQSGKKIRWRKIVIHDQINKKPTAESAKQKQLKAIGFRLEFEFNSSEIQNKSKSFLEGIGKAMRVHHALTGPVHIGTHGARLKR